MCNSKTPRFIFQSHVLSVYCRLKCYFIFKDVELHRKYEAIQLEFTGAGMLLKHFIVQYMEGEGVTEWVFVVHQAEMCKNLYSTGGEKSINIHHHISFSLHTHNLFASTHS